MNCVAVALLYCWNRTNHLPALSGSMPILKLNHPHLSRPLAESNRLPTMAFGNRTQTSVRWEQVATPLLLETIPRGRMQNVVSYYYYTRIQQYVNIKLLILFMVLAVVHAFCMVFLHFRSGFVECISIVRSLLGGH